MASQRKILVTGALGQIGSDLVPALRETYGASNVIASSLSKVDHPLCDDSFEVLDVLDMNRIAEIVEKHKITYIVHLASLLSAVGEREPQRLWKVNMEGLYNVLEVCRNFNLGLFVPSSIAAFGPETPPDKTPQDTVTRPKTIYGIAKISGELLCDYYHNKYGIDARGVRFPGLISYKAEPGGGTTDYAVEIYYEALKTKSYTCPLNAGTFMDMLYMPDAIDAILQLIEADPSKLVHRNAFNITAMSFDPEIIAASIRKEIPDFQLHYKNNPVLQGIANSWPNSLDDSAARQEWGWNPKFSLDDMTKDMLKNLRIKLNIQ